MAKLVLKEFRCVVESDEVGSDSPYFITFVGDITNPNGATIKLTAQGQWNNEVDQGELFVANDTVANGFSLSPSRTAVLVAVVEKDGGFDVNNSELTAIRNTLCSMLQGFKDSGATTVTHAIFVALQQKFRERVNAALLSANGAGDDLLGIRPRMNDTFPWLNGQPGPQSLMHFVGDGSHYRVRYAVA